MCGLRRLPHPVVSLASLSSACVSSGRWIRRCMSFQGASHCPSRNLCGRRALWWAFSTYDGEGGIFNGRTRVWWSERWNHGWMLSTDTYTQVQPGLVQGPLGGRVGGAGERPRKDQLSGADENRDLRHFRSRRQMHASAGASRPCDRTTTRCDSTRLECHAVLNARASNVG